MFARVVVCKFPKELLGNDAEVTVLGQKFAISILALIGCVAADVSQLSNSYLPPALPQLHYLPPAPEPHYLPPQPQPHYLPPAPESQYLPPVQPQPRYLPPAPEPQYLPPVQPEPQYLPPAPQPQYLPPAAEYLQPIETPVSQDGYHYKTVKKYRLRSH
ncbi:early nodulin-75-like [Rhagoletis pomonella]|uniref:early nodulin-75-like n=1 Tax=Rhagoletis pomonella TaxID=28610 RepID=UPI00177BE858|nr:early nodulin-75-like [Rhagoletis pomonella]